MPGLGILGAGRQASRLQDAENNLIGDGSFFIITELAFCSNASKRIQFESYIQVGRAAINMIAVATDRTPYVVAECFLRE